jgi:hypothetical protein
VQDVIPLQIYHGNQVVSGEAWRLFKEVYPKCKFSDFWLGSSFNVMVMLLPPKPQVFEPS